MRIGEIVQITVIGSVLVGGIVAVIFNASGPSPAAVTVDVTVPDLSLAAAKGSQIYDDNCAACHGQNSAGTEKGPPLIHDIYNPGHHSDDAFFRAVQKGVKQHHWPYGDMPPQPQASRSDVSAVITFIREVQQANGIYYQKHRM